MSEIENVTWTFKKDDSGDIVSNYNGREYVDLGLPSGLKWATMNVGATTPEEYGDYFAWGETEPYYTVGHSQDNPCLNWKTDKTGYDWASYKWCNGSDDSMMKYCTSARYGAVDNEVTLELADDAAHVNWGGNWRMPTKAEQDELRENCTWAWTTRNGVKGYKVTGPNGDFIFLPAAGTREKRGIYIDGHGFYGSSSLHVSDSRFTNMLNFDSFGRSSGATSRYDGLSVRAVCP